ncbi:MAG: MtdA bifunctional protein [Planctomycetaceae bacterium]|nr:MAG: MtdA bifunctional protein [Planctomycetaceae bacterium]
MVRILIHFDTDPLPSTFDRVVAVDAGVEHLFSYGGITPENVEPLVHGAMFTRKELKQTAIFVGGSRVEAAEAVLQKVLSTFFGPMRVAVMLDANGCNTTSAAAVRLAAQHVALQQSTAWVLGGTGPVGQRVAELLLREGARVWLSSRERSRAEATCALLRQRIPQADLHPWVWPHENLPPSPIHVVVSAGAAGAALLTRAQLWGIAGLHVALDLNAVPPPGLEGVDPRDKAQIRDGVVCYGALGVGGLKMKIHKAAIQQLFTDNSLVLETQALYDLACGLA